MAKQAGLHCSVITPDRQVFDADVDSVILPAHDGLIGVMHDRAPLVCEVGIGTLQLSGGAAGKKELFVDGGFAQVVDNDVTILTTRAMDPADINRAAAIAERQSAEKLKVTDDASFDARQKALARADAQLKLAKH